MNTKRILFILALVMGAIHMQATHPAEGDTILAQVGPWSGKPVPCVVRIDTTGEVDTVRVEPIPMEEYYKDGVHPSQYEKYKAVQEKVDRKASRLARRDIWRKCGRYVPRNGYVMGMCHAIWYYKKKILKEEYNIDWKSPQDLCPKCFFD